MLKRLLHFGLAFAFAAALCDAVLSDLMRPALAEFRTIGRRRLLASGQTILQNFLRFGLTCFFAPAVGKAAL
jgi:hypothetical protein